MLGGKVQPGSGSLPVGSLKGDVRSKEFLLDDKITNCASYSIKIADLRKLANQALSIGKRPILRVCFTQGSTYYLLDELTFAELTENR